MSVATSLNPFVGCKEITRCRICHSNRLTMFWESGPLMRIVDFPKLGEPTLKPPVPLRLLVCEDCWLVQLRHTTNPSYLYDEFWYRSGMNEMMRHALADVVEAALREGKLIRGDNVLDIGCNDGTLLDFYPPIGINRLGFDPAKNMQAISPGLWTFRHEYFSATRALEVSCGGKYKVVTALAMFYDLEDPVDFCRQVAEVLDPKGVFIIQMNYLPSMLERFTIDNVSHEHLMYYSLKTLRHVLDMAGLQVYKVELNEVNGGSIRAYVTHGPNKIGGDGSVPLFENREQAQHLAELRTYKVFADHVEEVCYVLNAWLNRMARQSGTVYAYGASTRGTTLLQLLDIEGKIVACAERDEQKIGRYMVGVNLPIVSEEEFRAKADYGLVLPYHFMDAIKEREKDWLKKGGKFMVPLPMPRLIGRGE